MTEKQRVLTLTIAIFLFSLFSLTGRDSTIVLGEEDLWRDAQLTNLTLIGGKRGNLDVTNSDNRHMPDRSSDLILSFNRAEEGDIADNYEIISPLTITSNEDSYGGGAAFFDGESKILIEQKNQALFSPSTLWGDFTLEFRLFPAKLKEGSTVFLWKGLQMIGNQLIPQEIRCTVTNRHLVWDFENFFLYPDDGVNRITLKGDKIIPGLWTHHMVIFDSETGLLEYRIDNIPSDSTYTSKTGREASEFNIPIIGNQQSFPIELGENFTGLLDEFRISSKIVERPLLNKYTSSGLLETDIIDLKVTGSIVTKITPERFVPANTSMRIYYAHSDSKIDLIGPSIQWNELPPSGEIGSKGRFLKVKVRMNAEPASQSAAVLSNLSIVYREATPPHPPLNLALSRLDEGIQLHWDKSIDPAISGYLVYIGEDPGVYFSAGSPIDAGSKNSIILSALDLNKRYYFAVTSYRSEGTRLESRFSGEISYSP